MAESNNQQHRTGKPFTQIAAQLRASSAIRCAGRMHLWSSNMKRLLILFPFLFQIQGCNDANATTPIPTMEYDVLHVSEYNEYGDSTNKTSIIINSQSDYESELLKRTSEITEEVDFDDESILLIDMGTQSTGGYSFSVTFTESNDYVKASVVFNFPGEGCAVDYAITNPFKLIKLETTKYILVTEEITFSSC